jgi:hypothetical protein
MYTHILENAQIQLSAIGNQSVVTCKLLFLNDIVLCQQQNCIFANILKI